MDAMNDMISKIAIMGKVMVELRPRVPSDTLMSSAMVMHITITEGTSRLFSTGVEDINTVNSVTPLDAIMIATTISRIIAAIPRTFPRDR
jgi:hypothetical protein